MPYSRLSPWSALILAALLLAAYAAPWLSGGSAALTYGGYDLAEWVSLHPEVRGGNPTLWAALLLRLPLTCIALLLALIPARARAQWSDVLRTAGIILLTIAQLPPLEFFTIAQGDVNYQQQFMLALATLILGIGALFAPLGKARAILILLVALAGLACSIGGISEANRLMQSFNIAAAIGYGAIATPALFLIAAVYGFRRRTGKQTE